MLFSSKSETLEKLESLLKTATVLPQILLKAGDWNRVSLEKELEQKGWHNTPLIVRSSANAEDCAENSFAGRFLSVSNVYQLDHLCEAIRQVVSSFGTTSHLDHVFIQPMLQSVSISGVAFSYDPRTGAPYWVVNYDDESGATNSVTSGRSNALKICYVHHSQAANSPGPLRQVIEMLAELESHFGKHPLDVEFAIDKEGKLFLLQVRSLTIKPGALSLDEHTGLLSSIESKIAELCKPHPHLLGSKSIYGVMPDWNPAEIIGLRPSPLSLSLYKEIITDRIWACRRENYGYRNLRGFPLMINLYGLPYIDVRVSFNSFIPADIEDVMAEKISKLLFEKIREPSRSSRQD